MPTPNEALVFGLAGSQALLNRYCADLTPQEYLRRPCPGANCAAWLIGHLILSERQALGRVGVPADQLPALPDGFETRFARDSNAPKADDFGDVTLLLPLFNRHRDLLIQATRNLPNEELDRPLDKPHPLFSTTAQVVAFMGTHVAMHAGQVTIIRRSLGRPPLV